MDEDYPLQDVRVQQDPEYRRDGTRQDLYQYRFYLGKHGPFTFRTPVDDGAAARFTAHVEQLRLNLRLALPS